MRYLVFIIALFAALQTNAQNNIVYGAGINYTNGAPTFTPPVRTSRVAIDTVTGKWYHFNTPGGWQLIGNTIEEIAGCTAPAYTPGKGDSKVVINNCSPQPELYFYNGSAWVLVGGGSVYAGEGIRIENDTIILDSLYILRFRTGSNTDGAAGAMSWNATEETVDLVTDQGAVTGHLMESAYYNTRNTTGSSIVVGTVVMANGTTGNTGRILIAPAIANGTVNSEYILGLAAQTIGNNSNGKVQHFGKIRGIQTNGANYGETWVDGDVLYCSSATPGYLTKVFPTAPNLKVPIAIVIHAHPSNGTLFVRPSHFPDLAQINDVQLSSLTNGQVLTYNSTLSRWENATPANQLQTLSTDGSAGNISISSSNTITLNVNDADASTTNELQTLSLSGSDLSISGGNTVTLPAGGLTGNGISPFVAQYNSTNTLDTTGIVWNGGLMGVGLTTTSPSARLHVVGSGTSSSTWTAQFHNSAGNNNALMIRDDGNVGIGTNNITAQLNIKSKSNNSPLIVRDSADNIVIGTNNSRTTYFGSSDGNYNGTVDINLSNHASRLAKIGSFEFTRGADPTFTGQGIRVDGTNRTFIFRLSNSNSLDLSAFRIAAGGASPNLGFSSRTSGTIEWMLIENASYRPTSGNAVFNQFTIKGQIEQTGGANGITRGVYVQPTLTSAANWRSFEFNNNTGWGFYGAGLAKNYFAGNTAIGTTTQDASSAFEVASTTQGVLFPRMTTAQRDLIATPANGLVIYNTSTNKLQVRAAGAWVDLH